MHWNNKPAVLSSRHVRWSLAMTVAGAVTAVVLLLVILMHAQPEQKRIAVYTPQTSYVLPVVDRAGKEYVGLLEMLEPMGTVSAQAEHSKWKLKFGNIEAECKQDKPECKIRKDDVKLASRFLIEGGRGLVPVVSLQRLLAGFLPNTIISVHEEARRVFIGGTEHRLSYEVKKAGPGKIVFKFSQPVNPFVSTEPGRLHMAFLRDPVTATAPEAKFDDQYITSAVYRETNGALEVTVSASRPLTAAFADGGRTVTVSTAAPPPVTTATQMPAPPTVPQAAQPRPELPGVPTRPAQKPRYLVVIDAAHGGDDRGGTLTLRLYEKDITLALARRLYRELQARGIQAMMTRDSDAALTFEQRAAIANASGAGLYIVLHASNAGRGIHLYTAAVAPELKNLPFVPWNSAQSHYLGASAEFAGSTTTELLKHDVEAAITRVTVPPLNAISSAACAIELSPQPGKRMDSINDGQYQQTIVNVIATVIVESRSKLEALR